MYIYKITNKINGKIYVGKTTKDNDNYFGSGILINKSIQKYGKENFDKIILEKCDSTEMLNKSEIKWIKELNSTDRNIGYNIAKGGEGGDTISNHPNKKNIIQKREQSLKPRRNDISIKLKEYYSIPENRKKVSDLTKMAMTTEVRDKISTTRKGKKLSDTHRKNIGEGMRSSEKYQKSLENGSRVRKMVETRTRNNSFVHTSSTKEKISKNNKAGTPEVRKKLREWNLKNSKSSKRYTIKNLLTNEIIVVDKSTGIIEFCQKINYVRNKKEKVNSHTLRCGLQSKEFIIIKKEHINE